MSINEAAAAKAAARRSARERHKLETLRGFDSLPDTAHVRGPIVDAVFGCSPATRWRWSRTGLLPKPVRLGPKATGWNVGALRATLKRSAVGAAA